jgi:hypothetical protein
MARDDFPGRVKHQLALRVNSHCSNPGCRAQTSGPKLAPSASISIGVAAHITAASTGGPRFDPALRSQDRGSAENGIWLCQNCAKLVDSDHTRFTEPVLREWKLGAEAEAREQLGKRASHQGSIRVLDSIHGQLRRESNPRFSFSFAHPSVWDREDPLNEDGSTYRHPQDSRIELRVWGGYAVVTPDLHSWLDWTLEWLQRRDGFCLLAKIPSGLHLIDWEDQGRSESVTSRQQVEGYRIVYETEEGGQSLTSMRTFAQFADTQVGLLCSAPSASYGRYEDLFLVLSKELRILGMASAPFARANKVDGGKSI